ncbi:hypothetical protein A5886_001009 [Enterococcus sp. 8G7_MSG3316]|uniref:Uncharacterized protein n=1 Tax=Candidatus Enterococcus testudinis TaxID=1834191 RepID=A0A242A5P7_9ENTE|nr:hypothetical protein [Enterococcus sp. 8G7_MSG3316]OTN75933.1 hypothetical protein A5886_001009 [Enterococcus sp. 8G7_MSG3316]
MEDTFAFDGYEHKLVECYTAELDSSVDPYFSVGFIIQPLDQDYFIFNSINLTGSLESIQLRKVHDITLLKEHTAYLDAFAYYIDYNQQHGLFDPYQLEAQMNEHTFDTIYELFNQLLQKSQIINILTYEDQVFTGKIALLDTENIVLHLLDFEDYTWHQKQTIALQQIQTIDLYHRENFLIQGYLSNKKSR